MKFSESVLLSFSKKQLLITLILVLGSLLLSCTETGKKRGYHLTKETIIEMIIDQQIAKAAAYKYPLEERDSASEMFHEQIYTIYNVDQFTFEHDLKKLETDPEYYKEIYDEVHNRMNSLRTYE